MSGYKPPFHMTDKMITLLAEISEQVGRITVLQDGKISPIFGERTESGPFILLLPSSIIRFRLTR